MIDAHALTPRLNRATLLLTLSCLMLNACSSSNSEQNTHSDLLGPLPNPPLSEGPSQDDQPVPENTLLNTFINTQLVRDPGERIPVSSPSQFTDTDFNAGPLPSELNIPVGLNTETNSPPDFENLMNVDAVAGEPLAIVFKPVDPDGVLPGMFPVALPPGSSFDDNFDGTKTFRWQPLEPDIGINAFSVTAVDASNNLYRNTRTILIRVQLPDNPATIPNLAPTLDPVAVHTARVNDPVVLELKGIDLNGTVPTLELLSDLPNASFIQHPRFDEVYTLRFIPSTTGNIEIEILVRDETNSSLSSTGTINLTVEPDTFFERPGLRLRDLAEARGIQIGYASLQAFYHRPDGGIYADIAASEFNLVTPENAMKMNEFNPLPGRYQYADIDNLVSFAEQNNMAVHGHPVLWYKQLPDWIHNVAPSELEGHMREYIDRLMSLYQNRIGIWDVVNEPIGENGGYRDSIWYQAMGERYIDIAFLQARSSAPDAVLLLNDFDIAVNGAKSDTLFSTLEGMLERNIPIDGVGFQLHLFSDFSQFDEVRSNFQKVADLGLDIYITELDVGLRSSNDLQAQATVFSQITKICLEQARCKAIQTWGFTDQYSFRENFQPLMFDNAYQAKPAYQAIQDALSQ